MATPRPSKSERYRGVALVEFALILPFLLVLSFLVVEVGRALHEYNLITKSVRDSVRYLSMQDPTIKVTDSGKVLIARNLVVYGNPEGTGTPLAPGLNMDHVPVSNITWNLETEPPPAVNPATINTVTIRVSGYGFRPLVPKVFGMDFGTNPDGVIPFGPISATMRSQL